MLKQVNTMWQPGEQTNSHVERQTNRKMHGERQMGTQMYDVEEIPVSLVQSVSLLGQHWITYSKCNYFQQNTNV